MSRDPLPAPGPPRPERAEDGGRTDLRQRLAKVLRVMNPVSLARRLGALEASSARHASELAATADRLDAVARRLAATQEELPRLTSAERRLDGAEEALRHLQDELERLRDGSLPEVERRADTFEGELRTLSAALADLRDEGLTAAVARFDVLVERLAAEHEELASLVERQLAGEPLPVPAPGPGEDELASALADVQPRLVAAFRGAEGEIRHRLERYLDELQQHAPVLDLGCGRGELLGLLREAGVAATGVEGDAALATGCRRRGLAVLEGDAAAVLADQPDGAWGAVTAVHLFEHLSPGGLLALLAQVHRVLRPGGLLLVESPNPHSLRVGGALYWLDPTHRRPLLPETLTLLLQASGFEIAGVELLHPFPAEELLAGDGPPPTSADPATAELGRRLEELTHRLDALLNGPRDFVLRARRAQAPTP